MQTVDQKIEAAVNAAMMALGLSSEMMPDTADALHNAIFPIAMDVVTSDFDDEEAADDHSLLENPSFLALTLKAQNAFGKAGRMNDEHGLTGQFAVQDMLDMLGARIDQQKSKK